MTVQECFLKLIDMIPKTLRSSGYVSKPWAGSSLQYTKENCEKFGIVYLENFTDLDTYINGNQMRVQGFHVISIDKLWQYEIEQYEELFNIIKVANCKFHQEFINNDVQIQLRIHNYSIYKP